jgi:rod shape-determining protein MreB
MAEDVVRRPRGQASRRAAFGTRDIAVDLGTANTLVLVRGEGIVLDEPSVVAVNAMDETLLAVGSEAKRMIGRTPPHIRAIRPLRGGVIADFENCEKMLRYFIQQVHSRRWAKPRMVICVPSGVTGVERRAVQEAAEFAGARPPVYIVDEPMAAAIGAGLPIADPTGSMIVDVGGGTTEVAVLSLGGVVASQSSRVGGDEMDDAIKQFLKKDKGVDVGDRTAEAIKVRLGSAHPLTREFRATVTGRSLLTGLPESVEFSTREIREALEEPLEAIIDTVKVTLDRTPPELVTDILDQGIHLAGGGSLLIGLPDRIRAETGMPTRVVADPLGVVVEGAGIILENFSRYGEMIFGDDGN